MRTILAACFFLATTAHAQSALYRFDMGSGATEAGFTAVTHNDVHGSPNPYGWDASDLPDASKTNGSIYSLIHATSKHDLLVDSVVTTGQNQECTFKVDVDSGTRYRCFVYVGDAGSDADLSYVAPPNNPHTPLERLGLEVEVDTGAGFTWIDRNFEVRTLLRKANVTDFSVTPPMGGPVMASTGGYRKMRFTVETPPGNGATLSFRFSANAQEFSYASIQGIEIWPETLLPVRFDHGVGHLQAVDSSASAFVTSMTIANYGQAASDACNITDPLTRACAHLWLAGWLDGSEEKLHAGDPQDEYLTQALADLALVSQPSSALAEMTDDALDFRAALFFDRLRAYTSDEVPTCPAQPLPCAGTLPPCSLSLPDDCKFFCGPCTIDCIIANINRADLLWLQIQGDMFELTDDPRIESSPLLPRSEYRRAAQYYGRFTKAVALASPAYNIANLWVDAITAVHDRASLFPGAANMEMFFFMADQYFKVGGKGFIGGNWTGDFSAAYTPATTWWGLEGLVPLGPATGPAWAQALRGYLVGLQNVAGWWIDRRFYEGELGGGDGDDVELVGALWGSPRVYSRDASFGELGEIQSALRVASDTVLYGPSVNHAQGYFQGSGDVEHAGEFTLGPLFGLMPHRYGDPNYLEVAMRLSRNTLFTDDAPWFVDVSTGGDPLWLFRSWDFGATNVKTPPNMDISLNMRALAPGQVVLDYAGDAVARDMIVNLARTWREACLDTGPGAGPKPRGVPPGAIRTDLGFPPPFYGATPGSGWWETFYANNANYRGHTFQILTQAYRHSTESLAVRETYLEPIYECAKLVLQFPSVDPDNFDPALASEAPQWAAGTYKEVFLDALLEAREEIYGSSLVQPGETAQFDALLAAHGDPYTRFFVSKDKTEIENAFAGANTWFQHYWPLATSAVVYTDRAAISGAGGIGSLHAMYAALSGQLFGPYIRPVVSWENPDPDSANPDQQVLDLAPLVFDSSSSNLHLLVHNFASGPIDVDFRIWNRLDLGQYSFLADVDANGDDLPDGGTPTTVTYRRKGQVYPLTVPGQSTLAVVMTQTLLGTPPGPLPDPGIGLGDVVHDGSGSSLVVRVHNTGTAATAGSVGVTVSDPGGVIGTGSIPSIAAPTNMAPSYETVVINGFPSPPTAAITVSLTYGSPEILNVNDTVELTLPAPYQWTALAAACDNGCGSTPDISTTGEPFVGSPNFTVELDNATGSTAFLVVASSDTSASAYCSAVLTDWIGSPIPYSLGGPSLSVPLPLDGTDGGTHAGLELYFQWAVQTAGGCISLSDALGVRLERP